MQIKDRNIGEQGVPGLEVGDVVVAAIQQASRLAKLLDAPYGVHT